jgi:hypothetical protein
MATYDWIGVNGDWGDAADWSGGPSPPPNDPGAAVNISAPGAYTVAIASGEIFQANTVTIGDTAAVLQLDGTSALYVSGDFTNSGGLELDTNSGDGGAHMTIAGTFTNQETVQIGSAQGTLSAATTLTLGRFYNASTNNIVPVFDVFGSASYAATVIATDLTSNSGVITLGDHAVFDVSGPYASFVQTSTGLFNEEAGATFTVSNGDTATFAGSAIVGGKVSGKGTLALAGGGSTVIEPGASLSIANWSVSDAGTTVALNENLTYAGRFSAGGGTMVDLAGGNLTLTGPSLSSNDTFSGATTSGSHTLHAKGYSTVSGLTIGGTSTFDNTGLLEQSGGDVTVGDATGDAAKLINGFTYDIEDDSGIGRGSSPASIIKNTDVFEKTGGAGTSAIAPEMVNSGKVYVSSGTLDFQGAVIGKGIDTIYDNGSTLEFDNYVASGQTVDFFNFYSVGAKLDLIDPYGFRGQIAGFAAGDKVALAGDWNEVGFSENAGGTLGTLTLTNGATQRSFYFQGDHAASDFNIAPGSTTLITHA